MTVEQLNKIQIKAEIFMVLSKLQTMPDVNATEQALAVLLGQEDKKAILDILIKELLKSNEQKSFLISYMLVRLCEKEPLETELWAILKNRSVSDVIKTIVLSLLKDMGHKIDYEKFNEYFENPDEVVDADTQKLLHVAIVNPEAQIDFLDFLGSLSDTDKRVLIQSLGDDYSSDDLANILIPVFLYSPSSELGRIALDILGDTKSQLALHALLEALDFVTDEELISSIKKNLSKLKIAGVREDNAIDFYKNILSSSKPYKSYTSYPDGHGNQALIFSREKIGGEKTGAIQIVAIVVNDIWGVVDCFGFNEITKTEFERIVDRFYNEDERVYINHPVLKNILNKAEELTRKTEGEISYEYICWKTLLSDIQEEPVPVEMILGMKFDKKALSDEDLERIYTFDFIQKWFMDTDSNQSFKLLVEDLNKQISRDSFNFDLDNVVKESSKDIFLDEERNLLDKRILHCAYLKYLSGEKEETQLMYSLYLDENQKNKLTENILRKSIYEYYVSLKFKQKEAKTMTNIFALKNKPKVSELTPKQIELMISIIESLWVEG